MTAKSEPLLAPNLKAVMRLKLGEPVELYWPDGSIETVTVVLIEKRIARVERTCEPNYFDGSIHIDVSREWLHPVKNG
ncbi:MAG: hypothetical protein AAGI37_06845 [Planctomycetota bacterium]